MVTNIMESFKKKYLKLRTYEQLFEDLYKSGCFFHIKTVLYITLNSGLVL